MVPDLNLIKPDDKVTADPKYTDDIEPIVKPADENFIDNQATFISGSHFIIFTVVYLCVTGVAIIIDTVSNRRS